MVLLKKFSLFYFILFFFNFKIFNSYMRSQTWPPPLPPPSPQHLSGSSPCTSPKHAVSCVRHRLAIQFLHDSILVRMPFSQIIPPSPSLSESKSPLYTSVSFFLSCIQGRHCHNHTAFKKHFLKKNFSFRFIGKN